jgi:hypothetical protein
MRQKLRRCTTSPPRRTALRCTSKHSDCGHKIHPWW